MKDKKGFTLIELLVTITLMLSILGIAIVSFIKVSDNKKNQAWESVKDQIITAAKNYFNTNQYYKEKLSNDYAIKVSLGKLISEDYLNIVTNPKTGETLDKCTYVELKKNNSKEEYSYVEKALGFCDFDNDYLVVETAGGPKISLKPEGESKEIDGTNWYTSNVTVEATGDTNNNGPIIKTGVCNDENCNVLTDGSDSDKYVDEKSYKDTNGSKTTWYKTINSSGKYALAEITLSVDTKPPTFKFDDFIYKVFNIKDAGSIEEINKVANFKLSISGNHASMKWTNPSDSSSKLENINKIWFSFEKDKNENIISKISNVDMKINEKTLTDKSCKETDLNCTWSLNAEDFPIVNNIEIVLTCKGSCNGIEQLDGSGFNIYSSKINKSLVNGVFSPQKNYNLIRIEPYCTDEGGSGCGDITVINTKIGGTTDIISGTTTDNKTTYGKITFEDRTIYTFKVKDKAGHESQFQIDTRDKIIYPY